MQSGDGNRAVRVAVLCIVALMVGAGLGKGAGALQVQRNPDPTSPATSQPSVLPSADAGMPGLPESPIRERMKEERVKALNDDRHKRLEDDVSKLQALTSELKSDVDKADKDELSLEVMRKAAEIEKLAHDVQDRMKK